ncbi:MAG: hypothetical protein U1E87_09520 [Alphaproteobacteria bacterium]
MLATVRSLAALLAAAALLSAGAGLQTTLLALRGQAEGFPTWVIGLFLSSYSIGFMAGCLHLPRVIREVGHIRVFAALAAITAAVALLHARAPSRPVLVFRAVNGFCLAGLSMVIESWLNDRAENASRGRSARGLPRGRSRRCDVRPDDVDARGPGKAHSLRRHLDLHFVRPRAGLFDAHRRAGEGLGDQARSEAALFRLAARGRDDLWCRLGERRLLGARLLARTVGLPTSEVAFMTSAIVAGTLAQYPVGWLDRVDRRGVLIATMLAFAQASRSPMRRDA